MNQLAESKYRLFYDSSGSAGMCNLLLSDDTHGILQRLFGASVSSPQSSLKRCKDVNARISAGLAATGINGLLFRRFDGENIVYIAEGVPEEYTVKTDILLTALSFWIDWLQNASDAFISGIGYDGLPYSIPVDIANKYKYIVLSKAVLSDTIEYSIIEKDSQTNEQKKISREALFGQ